MFTLSLVFAGALALPAKADSAATRVDIQCSVNSQGDATVTMGVMLRMEEARSNLSFPLPAGAKNITVNGSGASAARLGNAMEVDISRFTRDYIGDASIQFGYTLPEAVAVTKINDGKDRVLMLTLPLLNSFELPIENFSFTITLPNGELTKSPEFTSIYRQTSLASDLEVRMLGSQIIGSSLKSLNDHDGVTMTLIVPNDMFPTVSTYIREGNPELVPLLISAGVALLYWILFLSCLPLKSIRTTTPPEGTTAGELGCRLTMAGADLTGMVFTWAQLGYILIQVDDRRRVILHKRMDMGNERGPFENKVFSQLFAGRQAVDATGYGYADLVRKIGTQHPDERSLYKGSMGNVKLFRGLCCVCQAIAGVNAAMNLTDIFALQIILSIFFGGLGLYTSWGIQGIAFRTHLRGKVPVYWGLFYLLVWLIIGLISGFVWIPFCTALGQWLFGYLAAYGGRRSDVGVREAGIVLGLRKYLKHLPRYDVNRLLDNDPDYFFNLAPYALALGVIKPFGDAFCRRKIDQCPYLITTVQGKRTAEDWAKLLALTADMMDEKSRTMEFEKFAAIQIRVNVRRRDTRR